MANVNLVQPPCFPAMAFCLDNSEQDLIRLAKLTELQTAQVQAMAPPTA